MVWDDVLLIEMKDLLMYFVLEVLKLGAELQSQRRLRRQEGGAACR